MHKIQDNSNSNNKRDDIHALNCRPLPDGWDKSQAMQNSTTHILYAFIQDTLPEIFGNPSLALNTTIPLSLEI